MHAYEAVNIRYLCHLLFTNMLERDGHTMNVHVLQSRTILKFKKLY